MYKNDEELGKKPASAMIQALKSFSVSGKRQKCDRFYCNWLLNYSGRANVYSGERCVKKLNSWLKMYELLRFVQDRDYKHVEIQTLMRLKLYLVLT